MAISILGVAGSLCGVEKNDAGITLTLTMPASLQAGDTVIAVVLAKGTVSTPSGWTKIADLAQPMTSSGTDTANGYLFQKNSVSGADSLTSINFTRNDNSDGIPYYGPFCGFIFGARGVVSIPEIKQRTDDWYERGYQQGDAVIPMETATATSNGEVHVQIGLSYFLCPYSPFLTPPSGATRFTQGMSDGLSVNIGGAYIVRNAGQSSSGTMDLAPTAVDVSPGTVENAVATFTIRLSEAAPGPAQVDTYVSVPSILDGSAPTAVASYYHAAARASAPSPLDTAPVRLRARHDFTRFLDASYLVEQYAMDLVTPGGLVRAPISSWQATLQLDAASFAQCVVPAVDGYIDAIGSASEFVILRRLRLLDGRPIEVAVAGAPLETVSFAQGAFNHTATIQGYIDALSFLPDPPPLETPVQLREVRTVFTYSSGLRVRCAVDWMLQPGMTAYLDSTPLVVGYINLYATGAESFMDVGERA